MLFRSGIDLFSVQIEEGNKIINFLGLENIKLIHQNVLEFDEKLGKFDYIICHGVFSWVNEGKQDIFGVLDDVIAAVKSENRTAISDVMLPRIDRFIDNLLKVLSTNGALQNRYESNKARLVADDAQMTESLQDLVSIKPEEAITELSASRPCPSRPHLTSNRKTPA